MNRIALSPLTATLLLIVFSVALGAVVLTWGESFVEAEASRTSACPVGCVSQQGATGGAVFSAERDNVKVNNEMLRTNSL